MHEFCSNFGHIYMHCNTAVIYLTLLMFPEVVSDRQQDGSSATGLFFFPVSLVSVFLHVSSAQEDYWRGTFSPL